MTRAAVGPLTGTVSGTALQVGQTFARRYRILRVLGAGGMGAVYQAWDAELDVPIAVKVIRPEITGDTVSAREFERRFKQELLLARQVTHRNVLRIHDLGDADGTKYITMPFVDGPDLAAILREGRIPMARVRRFALQLAEGLAAAHDVGVVHRDLKPQNILVGAGDHVYISDFGLARSLGSAAAGLTRAGEFLGTPRYMAPEQIEGGQVDHRADLYALGLILFEMATGAAPFAGASLYELISQRVREPAPPVQAVDPQIPARFGAIVSRLLERDPAARYQSAHDVVADLRAEAGEETSGVRTAVGPRAARRRIAIAVAALVGLGTATAGGVWYLARVPTGGSESAPVADAERLRHVAVLPFRVIGDAKDLGYIAGGLQESLSARLFQVRALTVASAPSVERAVAGDAPAERVAQQLGVGMLVSGSLRGSGDRIRATVSVDNMIEGRRVWSEEFSGVTGDLLTLEDRVYQAVIRALQVTPTPEEAARSLSQATQDVTAYDLYLRGRDAMRSQQDLASVKRAIDLFERAAKQDPRFALAYTGLADASLRMYRETREATWMERSLAAVQKALLYGEGRAEVHAAAGAVYQATGRNSEAVVELRRAADLAPSSDEVRRRLGRTYLAIGQPGEALQQYSKAVEANPYYWVNHNALGAAYLSIGEYARARDAFARVIELEPDNVNGHNDLGATYLQLGMMREASQAFARALELQPNAETWTNLGIALASQRQFDQAVEAFEKAVELNPTREMFVGNLADGYRWAGRASEANARYDEAIALAYKELAVNPRNAIARSNLGLYFAKKGNTKQGLTFVRDALAASRTNVMLMYAEAVVLALAQRTDEALAALDRALEAGYPAALAAADPDLAVLKTSPEFERIIKRRRQGAGST